VKQRRGVWLASALALASGTASAERADDGSVSLDWKAPPSCPSASAVIGKVRSLVSATTTAAERVEARGAVTEPASDGNWQLTLETVQGARTWQRSLRAASCEELADAGALIIALTLDPSLQAEEKVEPGATPVVPAAAAPPASTPVPPPAATAKPSAAPVPAPSSADAQRPPPLPRQTASGNLDVHVAASAVSDWGTLPRIAFGPGMAAGFSAKPVEVELFGFILPEVEEVIAEGPRGGNIGLVAAGLRGCYELTESPLGTRLCAGFEAGRIHGTGFGTVTHRTRGSLWTAARLGGFARYPLAAPLALRFGAEGVVPLTRPKFELTNVGSGPVHQPSPVALRLELGLELLFR
jgi:hypothetical protein